MPRFYLRLILIPFLSLTAVLLLIRAQPYDDHEMQQFLVPEGCPAPCFMGIRPGVTTYEEALAILKATGWMAGYDGLQNMDAIRIKWNDTSPRWLPHNGLYTDTSIWINHGLVREIFSATNLSLGDLQLTIGTPPFQQIFRNEFEGFHLLSYSAIYPKQGIAIQAERDCDHERGSITYHDTVELYYGEANTGSNIPPNYDHSWLDVMHISCR